ncbi:MAG: hypothetical protein ACI4DV_00880 [Lachnospiraceae bacterium]
MVQNKKKCVEFLGCMLLSVILFAVIYRFIPIVYSTNDDRMIMEFVSGQFTGRPESCAIQMTFGFTWFLSRLYRLSGALNWYGIVLIGLQIFSYGAVLYRLQSRGKDRKKKVLILAAALLIYAALWVKVFVQMTYTTTAAFVGAAALLWYALSEDAPKNVLMTGLLAGLAFSVRPNVFYMLIPSAGIIWIWKITEKKRKSGLVFAAPFLMLAVIGGLFAVDYTANHQEGWKEFRKFFDERTQIYDFYDLLSYEEHPELYEPSGVTEDEYNMLRIYDYTVLGDLPQKFFPEYIENYQQMERDAGITPLTRGIAAVKTFVSDVFYGSYGLENTVFFAAALLLIIRLLRKKDFRMSAYLVLQCAAILVLWLYMNYWERAIGRIQVSLSLIQLAVLLHVLCTMEKPEISGVRIKRIGIVAAFAGLTVAAGMNFRNCRYDNIYKADQYRDIQAIKTFCAENPEDTFFMDVASITEQYGTCTIRNTDPEYMNYIPLGDWSAYCPHYYEKLKKHGVDDVTEVREALTRENSYVIMLYNYQLQCLMDYLGEGYDSDWTRTIFSPNGNSYAVYEIRAVNE